MRYYKNIRNIYNTKTMLNIKDIIEKDVSHIFFGDN